MKVTVVIASSQRPAILADTLASIKSQSRAPDEIVVSVVEPCDVPDRLDPNIEVVLSGRGASQQRNVGLSRVKADAGFVAFLDDDIILHRDYLLNMEEAFSTQPDAALIMGHLLANGGVSADQAKSMLNCTPDNFYDLNTAKFGGVYGCNMCVRLDVARAELFDERLALYSLMEDVDFGTRVRRYGHVGYNYASIAVHLRSPEGRVSHQALGFSEVMNPVYLASKGTIPVSHAIWSFVVRKPAINFIRSMLRTERTTEHRSRLRGNILAIKLLARGSICPEKVVDVMVMDSLYSAKPAIEASTAPRTRAQRAEYLDP